MDPKPQAATIEEITAAMMAVDGKTPSAVLEAFIPKTQTCLGRQLVPITVGHELALSQLNHPLATGRPWEDMDVLTALFVFTQPSRMIFSKIAGGTFEADFFEFIDSIPTADIAGLGSDMVAHWMRSRATAIGMENPHSTTQKKTAASGGFSMSLGLLARFTDGILKWFSTIFRLPRSSP